MAGLMRWNRPGTGLTIKHFDKSKVTKIFGIEPNPGMHDGLRKSIAEAGLEGIYEIVGGYRKTGGGDSF